MEHKMVSIIQTVPQMAIIIEIGIWWAQLESPKAAMQN